MHCNWGKSRIGRAIWRLSQHSMRERIATRGEAVDMVRSRSTWVISLELCLWESTGGARIKIVMIMIKVII